MRKVLFTILATMTLGTSLFAALPPLHQSVREINAILTHEALSQHFDQNEMIKEVVYIENNNYIVSSEEKNVCAEIVYAVDQEIGPAKFDVVFHPEN